jgi:hypothetical protein
MGADLYDPQCVEALEVHVPLPPSAIGLQGMSGGKSGHHGAGKEGNAWPFIRDLARRKGKHDAGHSMSDRPLDRHLFCEELTPFFCADGTYLPRD